MKMYVLLESLAFEIPGLDSDDLHWRVVCLGLSVFSVFIAPS